MSVTVLFLHELKHVEFHAKNAAGTPRPKNLAEEKLQCDMWAREWFMSNLASYASKNKLDYQRVCSKRAMALLLVCEYLRLADQQMEVLINNDYSPLKLRISKFLSGVVNLPEYDNFWILAACILLAKSRRQKKASSQFQNMGTSKNRASSAAGWPVAMKVPVAARDLGSRQNCSDEKEVIFRGAHINVA